MSVAHTTWSETEYSDEEWLKACIKAHELALIEAKYGLDKCAETFLSTGELWMKQFFACADPDVLIDTKTKRVTGKNNDSLVIAGIYKCISVDIIANIGQNGQLHITIHYAGLSCRGSTPFDNQSHQKFQQTMPVEGICNIIEFLKDSIALNKSV